MSDPYAFLISNNQRSCSRSRAYCAWDGNMPVSYCSVNRTDPQCMVNTQPPGTMFMGCFEESTCGGNVIQMDVDKDPPYALTVDGKCQPSASLCTWVNQSHTITIPSCVMDPSPDICRDKIDDTLIGCFTEKTCGRGETVEQEQKKEQSSAVKTNTNTNTNKTSTTTTISPSFNKMIDSKNKSKSGISLTMILIIILCIIVVGILLVVLIVYRDRIKQIFNWNKQKAKTQKSGSSTVTTPKSGLLGATTTPPKSGLSGTKLPKSLSSTKKQVKK